MVIESWAPKKTKAKYLDIERLHSEAKDFNLKVQVTKYENVVHRDFRGVRIKEQELLIIDEATIADKTGCIILKLKNGMLLCAEQKCHNCLS